jgi:predicted ATP-grasp superfamily ATP-dependent carboligase
MPIDPKTIAELKSKHGDIYVLSSKGSEVVVRGPTDAEWGAYLDEREKRGARASKMLVLTCAVHPDEDAVRTLLDRKPALAQIFGARVLEIAGMEEEATVKKA